MSFAVSSPSTPTIAILGAGLSGICLGIQLKRAGIDSFTIFEKSDGVGGTWRDNQYPGAACDVPSMFYSFSFEVKTDWSRVFAQQPEILEYIEGCVEKYGLEPHLRLGTEIESVQHQGEGGGWVVRTTDGAEHRADVVASGVGQLNRPFVPEIAGLDDFGGVQFHSARWRHDCDLNGKTVAVVGNGASAVQLIPEVAKEAKQLYVFQRSANWMIPRNDRPYTEREKKRFARYPWFTRLNRALIWTMLEARWPAFSSRESRLGKMLEKMCLDDMRKSIDDPALIDALTPDYPVGCKRILIADDYYPALARPNVEVVTTGIEAVTRDGIRTVDGTERDADVLVLATGFRTTEFLQPMDIRGRGGLPLNDVWARGAEAYLGVALPDFPNFFMMYGPNTNLGHNSIILMIECQVRYIMQCVERLRRGEAPSIEIRPEAMRRFRDECDRTLESRVWATGCESWYKNADGRITNNWPWGTVEYWRRTRRPELADFVA